MKLVWLPNHVNELIRIADGDIKRMLVLTELMKVDFDVDKLTINELDVLNEMLDDLLN